MGDIIWLGFTDQYYMSRIEIFVKNKSKINKRVKRW